MSSSRKKRGSKGTQQGRNLPVPAVAAPAAPPGVPETAVAKTSVTWDVRATIAVVGVVVSICSAVFGAWIATGIQTKREELQTSRIGYAFFVQPAPPPGEAFEQTGRWKLGMQIFNSGPADARTLVLNLHTPPPAVFLHSAPELMSDAAVAKVEVKKRAPDGIYQVVITNLIKGDTLFLQMFYAAPDERKEEFMRRWREGGMFDEGFAKRFINQFFFTGEHLEVTNFGALPLRPAFTTHD